MKPKILNVRIEHHCDESPDTSHMGEYRNESPTSGYYLDRKTGLMHDGATDEIVATDHHKNHSRGEYQYLCDFQHSGTADWSHVTDSGVHSAYLHCRYRMNGSKKGHSSDKNLFSYWGVKGWQTAQTRNEKIRVLNIVYCCEDADRMESLQSGQWCMIGVIAKAQIDLSGVVQTIRSGGLWGVESDSEPAYLKEIEDEQLGELRTQLEAIGIGSRAIGHAFKSVEHKDA